jgi:asparagine synthase (glutamine-hydrolysing)
MCGIAGFTAHGNARDERLRTLRSMCGALVHRGPDDEGFYTDPDVGLGMRRLSIIDLEGGQQPISNEDGTVHVVFNGEIYNHRELRSDLRNAGHRFTTRSDTEVLVHLYEDHGVEMVHRLRGMFAFALWDERRSRLFLARDRLGIKPLYYTVRDGELAFASELKALAPFLRSTPEIDRRSLGLYLAFGYVPDPHSIYQDLHKLAPGHRLIWGREAGAEVERYWSPVRAESPVSDERAAVERLRELLEEAVRYRLIADVPLGAFLSGGLDSSAVVASMARAMDRPVRTFTIGFEDPRWNEAPHAAEVASALGTDHTELIVKPDVEDLFEKVAVGFDEPFADSSAIPMYLVSKLARDHVKVCLSGDGGDELFGGYVRYREMLRRNGEVSPPIRSLLRGFARRLPRSAYGRNRLLELSRSRRGRYAGMVARSPRVDEGGVARKELAAAVPDVDRLLDPWFDEADARDFPSQLMLVDALTYLPGDILTKVDRMSMAVSLEARVPLLDHRLAEFAFSLPSRMKLRNGGGKWIFREALRDLLPNSVFRKPKHGFGVPLGPWFRHELRHRCRELVEDGHRLFEYVEPGAVRQIVGEHQRGRRDHSQMIWRLLVLRFWLDRVHHPEGDPSEVAVS